MLKLTRHFIDNWRERVGNDPTPDAVTAIINESIRLQQGRRLGHDSVLTWYCHFGLKLALSVDRFRGNVVSVLSEDNMPDHTDHTKQPNQPKKQRCVMQDGYITMTMHRR